MKRLLIFLIILLLLSSPALADVDEEILFRGLPWGISIEETIEKLVDQGALLPEITEQSFGFIVFAYRTTFHRPGTRNMGQGLSIVAETFPDGFNVATHKLKSLTINCPFVYNGNIVDYDDTYFFSAEMDFQIDGNSYDVYYDLLGKLEKIYGLSREGSDTESYRQSDGKYHHIYMTWNEWRGRNETGVCLYHEYSLVEGSNDLFDEEVRIIYGKTDGASYLDGVKKAVIYTDRENEKKQLLENGEADGL